MKPCYCYGENLLVLAEILKEGGNWWQSCKARISKGTPPSITTVTKVVAARAGWWNSSDGEALHQEAPVLLHCKLRVGTCELSAEVHVVDKFRSLEQSVPFDWHIDLGQPVIEALISASWDADVCYLDCRCKRGFINALPEDPDCCTSFTDALRRGHKSCMRYWHGKPTFSPIANAEYSGLWHCNQLFWVRQAERQECQKAALQPTAEALMYVRDILGMSWDNTTCLAAAQAGSINCLSYAHCSGCPWDMSVCNTAAKAGKLACLAYAHEHGCEWDKKTCEAAAAYGNLECLVYAHTHGCNWDEATCRWVADTGNLEILAYAHENGCPWDLSTCYFAAYFGRIECLVYAHEHDCPWGDTVSEAAVKGGSLQCLRYAHEHGCCWSESTLFAAAMTGILECLIYAHKNWCPYDAGNCSDLQRCKCGLSLAACQGLLSLPCLIYVHESMGCSWDGSEWMHAFWEGQLDVLKYIHQHGGAWLGDREEFDRKMSDDYRVSDQLLDQVARCALYMQRYGGCKLPPLKGTRIGKWLAMMRERLAVVLLVSRAAGRMRSDAALAAMAMVPTDVIMQILRIVELLL